MLEVAQSKCVVTLCFNRMLFRLRCHCRRRAPVTSRWHRLVRTVVILQRVRQRWAALGRFLQHFRRV